jgi:hypothetical protein
MNAYKWAAGLAVSGILLSALAACGGSNNSSPTSTAGSFASTTLVSDGSIAARHTDPNLQNGWGVAFNPTTRCKSRRYTMETALFSRSS